MAWFEEAAGGRTALSVPCSAGGVCDEATGTCSCRGDMFEGDACDVLACPTCSNQGTCRDMEYFAGVSERRPRRPPQAERPFPSEDGRVAVAGGSPCLLGGSANWGNCAAPSPPDSPMLSVSRACREGCVGRRSLHSAGTSHGLCVAPADGRGQRRGATGVHVRPLGRQQDALVLVQPDHGRRQHVLWGLHHLPRAVRPRRHGLLRLRLQPRKVKEGRGCAHTREPSHNTHTRTHARAHPRTHTNREHNGCPPARSEAKNNAQW